MGKTNLKTKKKYQMKLSSGLKNITINHWKSYLVVFHKLGPNTDHEDSRRREKEVGPILMVKTLII